jgi:hypothetical protein
MLTDGILILTALFMETSSIKVIKLVLLIHLMNGFLFNFAVRVTFTYSKRLDAIYTRVPSVIC